MRIVHVSSYSPVRVIGGVARVIWELSIRQVKAGHEVHIVTSDWDKTKRIKIKDEVVDGIHIHYCKHWFKVSHFAVIWPGGYKKLFELKPDVIHAHMSGHLHTWFAMKAAIKLKVPFIVTTHCPWEAQRTFMGRIANYISYNYFPTLRYADAVIAITKWEHRFLKGEWVDKKRIFTIPNGMSSSFFDKVKPNKFNEKHNIPFANKVVLFFGRLDKTKNPLMFLDIAENIIGKRNDVTFVIRGPDYGELTKIEEKIEDMPQSVQKNIRLLLPTQDRTEIAEMYQGADIYVAPSVREGNPLCMYEAYASGLPVVASAVNGVPYGLTNKVNGFLLKPTSFNGFINKIELLLDDKGLRNKISQNNMERAKDYDWDLITKETIGVYNKVRDLG